MPLVIVLALMTPTRGDESATSGEPPDYPRTTLLQLRSEAADGAAQAAEAAPSGPFVVVVTAHRSSELGDDMCWVSQPVGLCCVTGRVLIRAKLSKGAEVVDREWIALYGRLTPAPINAFDSAPAERPSGSVIRSWMIEAERIDPAERLVYSENVVQMLDSPFTTVFARAVRESGVAEQLAIHDGVTMFAPVDAAFDNLPADEFERLFDPTNRERLRHFVLNHVVADRLTTDRLYECDSATTLSKRDTEIVSSNGALRFGTGRILFRDIKASNGVIHLIHQVQTPRSDFELMLERRRRALNAAPAVGGGNESP